MTRANKGTAKNRIIFRCRQVSYHTETFRLDPRDRFKVFRYREISLMPRFCLRQVSLYKLFNNEMRNISKHNSV